MLIRPTALILKQISFEMRPYPVATKLNAPGYDGLVAFMESLKLFLILKVWKL